MRRWLSLTRFIRLAEEATQHLGVSVSPCHFYSEIPRYAELRRETYWRVPWTMVGVNGAELEPQRAFATTCCAGLGSAAATPEISHAACRANGEGGFGEIEAAFLYGFIRNFRPRRIIQVGAGVSTSVILRAAAEAGYTPTLRVIDPYPTAFLRAESKAGRIELREERAQETPLSVLTELEAGDLLFVDSTHTVRLGSEVVRIVLEVLPRLAPGTFVHFHDIFFPYDYAPAVLLDDVFFHRENVLLLAFLAQNPGFRIAASLSMLHHASPELLKSLIPFYDPCVLERGLQVRPGHFPSSIYLERLADRASPGAHS